MKDYIAKLHARPSHEKRRFSMRAAAGVMAAVFLIWLTTFSFRLENDIAQQGAADQADANFSGLAAVTASVGSDIAGKFGEIRSTLSALSGPGLPARTASSPQAAPAVVIAPPAGTPAATSSGSN